MSNTIKEVRYLVSEIRADEQTGIVEGTAIRFNVLSQDLGGFREMIKVSPDNMLSTLNDSDIVMLYNHDTNSQYTILARSKKGKGSLSYTVDEQGVHFKFKVKDKDKGIIESLNAGDLDGCSFGFLLDLSDDQASSLERQIDGSYVRYIYKFFSITDFSIVVYPAYTETSVSASVRSLIEDQKKKELDELQKVEDLKRNKDQEFNNYYSNMVKKYLK